jgi:lipopolysaccharide transport system ATP-binding protein
MPSDIAVSVRHVSKSYTISHDGEKPRTLVEAGFRWLKNPLRRSTKETFWALNDVSFDIKKGDVVGIIGRNGAGKSTLLKILSRITEPTAGEIHVFGRVGSLLEVGTGFHPDLTGRENVFLNGAILGMTKAEIRRQFDAIVDFAGVEKFLDTPVKRYSSGMYVRLAFAVAAHLKSDILIVDEVLAVGDAEFQRKCMAKIKGVAEEGRTVLFVSHSITAVQNLCNQAILLVTGRVAIAGNVPGVVEAYRAAGEDSGGVELRLRTDRLGDQVARVEQIQLLDTNGAPLVAVNRGSPFVLRLTGTAREAIGNISASIDIDAPDGTRLTSLFSGFQLKSFDLRRGAFQLDCQVEGLPLRPAEYSLNVFLCSHRGHHDFVTRAGSFEVGDVDFYKTGILPEQAHGPIMPAFQWTNSHE